MKYRYELLINSGAEGKEIAFPYGSTKTARLRVSYNRATLIAELSNDYTESFSKSYAVNLMKEGVKRVALVHVLKYSKPISISDLEVVIYEGEDRKPIKDVEDLMNFYSLIDKNLHLPKQIQNDKVIESILKIDKTHAGNRYASLYSYLYSCQQDNEINRFIYQWMAINGMYSFVGSKTEKDIDSIANLAKQLGFGNQVLSRKKRDKVGPQISMLLQNINLPVTRDSLENGEHNYLAEEIDKIVNRANPVGLNMTTYGFLVLDYAYYLRCNYFHAGMPVTLFCYKTDIEYNALSLINGLLKEFLENYMDKLFDGTIYSEKTAKATDG